MGICIMGICIMGADMSTVQIRQVGTDVVVEVNGNDITKALSRVEATFDAKGLPEVTAYIAGSTVVEVEGATVKYFCGDPVTGKLREVGAIQFVEGDDWVMGDG